MVLEKDPVSLAGSNLGFPFSGARGVVLPLEEGESLSECLAKKGIGFPTPR